MKQMVIKLIDRYLNMVETHLWCKIVIIAIYTICVALIAMKLCEVF